MASPTKDNLSEKDENECIAGPSKGFPPGAEDDYDYDGDENDLDDEETLREEEEMAAELEENSDELDCLQREGELPLEELMKMYGYGERRDEVDLEQEEGKESEEETEEESDEESGGSEGEPERKKAKLSPTEQVEVNENSPVDAANALDADQPEVRVTVGELLGQACSRDEGMDSDSGDSDYVPSSKKEPRVGSQFQIESLPVCNSSPVNLEQPHAECMWDPAVLTKESDLEELIKRIFSITPDTMVAIPDDANLLTSVMKEKGDLTKVDYCPVSEDEPSEVVMTFTDEEIESFEEGLRLYGKDFGKIKSLKLPNKPVSDLVSFYYFWKKTDRYDLFAASTKLGKSKQFLDENVTDFMWRLSQDIQTLPQPPLFARDCSTTRSTMERHNANLVPPDLKPQIPCENCPETSSIDPNSSNNLAITNNNFPTSNSLHMS